MYKNFSLTESEKQQIMEMHQSRGYKTPLNESTIVPNSPTVNKLIGMNVKLFRGDELAISGQIEFAKKDTDNSVVFKVKGNPTPITFICGNDMDISFMTNSKGDFLQSTPLYQILTKALCGANGNLK